MYTDLRKYISIPRYDLEKGSFSSFMKTLCEYAHDEALATNTVMSIVDGMETGCTAEDFDELNTLLEDMHAQDFFGTEENVMLHLLINCFVDDYLMETDSFDRAQQYIDYSNIGRRIRGLEPNALSEYLSEEWDDFNYIYDYRLERELTSEEIIARIMSGELEDMLGEECMASIIIVVDEYEPGYDALVEALYQIGFVEIEPGLIFSGTFGSIYDGYGYEAMKINQDERENIIRILEEDQKEKRRFFDEDIFVEAENCIERLAATISQILKISNSNREVMF